MNQKAFDVELGMVIHNLNGAVTPTEGRAALHSYMTLRKKYAPRRTTPVDLQNLELVGNDEIMKIAHKYASHLEVLANVRASCGEFNWRKSIKEFFLLLLIGVSSASAAWFCIISGGTSITAVYGHMVSYNSDFFFMVFLGGFTVWIFGIVIISLPLQVVQAIKYFFPPGLK